MADDPAAAAEKMVKAHAAADAEELARLRGLSLRERGQLLQSACEAVAEIRRARLAAGLPDVEPDPWPESTRDFFRKHAARFHAKAE